MENTAISVTIKTRILNEIDNNRGDVPRSKYISKLLERVFEESKLENIANNKVFVDRNSLTATDQQRIIVKGGD